MDLKTHLTSDTLDQLGMEEPCCVEPSAPLGEVLEQLQQRRAGSALVCREGRLVGIFTERDALRLLAQGAELSQPIQAVMTPNPVSLPASATVADAIRTMSQGGYRRVPVVDELGRPLGVIKVAHIVHYLVDFFPQTVYNLPPNPDAVMQQREGA